MATPSTPERATTRQEVSAQPVQSTLVDHAHFVCDAITEQVDAFVALIDDLPETHRVLFAQQLTGLKRVIDTEFDKHMSLLDKLSDVKKP